MKKEKPDQLKEKAAHKLVNVSLTCPWRPYLLTSNISAGKRSLNPMDILFYSYWDSSNAG
jgi:hypothetical protein